MLCQFIVIHKLLSEIELTQYERAGALHDLQTGCPEPALSATQLQIWQSLGTPFLAMTLDRTSKNFFCCTGFPSTNFRL